MEREIKFRAWDKENEEMLPNVVPFEDRCWIDIGMSGEHGELENDHIIMQFIGLKDKNGKEIYEGDILSRDLPIGGKDFYHVTSEEQCGGFEPFFSAASWLCPSDTEVIGNIYENRELLDGHTPQDVLERLKGV